MHSLHQLCHFGHFQLTEHLMKVREMLALLGEAHSAFNTVLALKLKGIINARFADLTGWQAATPMPFAEMIEHHFKGIDFGTELVIAPGYTHCTEGLMNTFDRGYTEIAFGGQYFPSFDLLWIKAIFTAILTEFCFRHGRMSQEQCGTFLHCSTDQVWLN